VEPAVAEERAEASANPAPFSQLPPMTPERDRLIALLIEGKLDAAKHLIESQRYSAGGDAAFLVADAWAGLQQLDVSDASAWQVEDPTDSRVALVETARTKLRAASQLDGVANPLIADVLLHQIVGNLKARASRGQSVLTEFGEGYVLGPKAAVRAARSPQRDLTGIPDLDGFVLFTAMSPRNTAVAVLGEALVAAGESKTGDAQTGLNALIEAGELMQNASRAWSTLASIELMSQPKTVGPWEDLFADAMKFDPTVKRRWQEDLDGIGAMFLDHERYFSSIWVRMFARYGASEEMDIAFIPAEVSLDRSEPEAAEHRALKVLSALTLVFLRDKTVVSGETVQSLLSKTSQLLGPQYVSSALRYTGAFDEFVKALEATPEDRVARLRQAESLVEAGAKQNSKGKLAEARTIVDDVLAQDVDLPEAHFVRAKLYLAEGKADDAVASLRRVLDRRDDWAPAHFLLGVALLDTGQGQLAEGELRRAIELDPNNVGAYLALATYLLDSNRRQEGISTYEKAVEKEPNSAPLRLELGQLYDAMGRRADAVVEYEEAVKLDPNLAVAKNNLAYLMAGEGMNLKRALDLAQEARAQLPDDPNVADTLGFVHLQRGEADRAAELFRQALERTDSQTIRYRLGLALGKMGEKQRALETLRDALAGGPFPESEAAKRELARLEAQ
jgi:tetratricopeptide (TPR) repeat protein